MRTASMVVRVDSMAVMVFWAISATSMTGICAWATDATHRSRSKLRLSRVYIASPFCDRDTLAIDQLLLATLDAIEGRGLPVRDAHTAPRQQTDDEGDDPEEFLHTVPLLLPYCGQRQGFRQEDIAQLPAINFDG